MARWQRYRKDISEKKARNIVKSLLSKGKVWGKTVTTTNEFNKYTVWIKK